MKVGIIGATGYTGLGLLNDLAQRPKTEVTVVTSRQEAGRKLASFHPNLAGVPGYKDLVLENPADLAKIKEQRPDSFPSVFFLAVKHKVSMTLVPKILQLGAKIIDLTGDFRLKNPDLYPQWYKFQHDCPEYLKEAVYGLPELHREEIKKARLIANPGCYPTSVILALAPLVKNNHIKENSVIIVDSKSGVTGAGREPLVGNIFCEVSENFRAYKVVGHQHTPEMLQELDLYEKKIPLTFTPHLVPMNRGILSTIYVEANNDLKLSKIMELYHDYYQGEKFIRLRAEGDLPQTLDVRGTNFCDIALFFDEFTGILKIISVIDNLARGATTQAMVNLNLISGEDEALGVPMAAFRP
jgi:N-acetyl-gamma-glutamyl-phosphate reductase